MKVKVVSQYSPKLLDRMRAEIRVRHYSIRTVEVYLDWARHLLNAMSGTMGLVTSLLYGTGMCLLEGIRLRVRDVEFTRREIVVREAERSRAKPPLPQGARGLTECHEGYGAAGELDSAA